MLTLHLSKIFDLSPSRVTKMLLSMVSVHRQRADLSRLTMRELEDIGVTPEQATAEAARRFWDFAQLR